MLLDLSGSHLASPYKILKTSRLFFAHSLTLIKFKCLLLSYRNLIFSLLQCACDLENFSLDIFNANIFFRRVFQNEKFIKTFLFSANKCQK